MSYDMVSYNLFNSGYNPYNMTGSLYMLNFYNQLKNYYAGSTAKTAGNSGDAAVTGTANTASADFQTAFQEAFRKALQDTMGITGSTETAASGAAGAEKSAAKAVSNRTSAAQTAYQTMSSYNCHPSHIWTSNFV